MVKQGYKQTEIGILPEDWDVDAIGSIILSFATGGNYKNSTQISPYPLIKMGNISRGHINLNKVEYVIDTVPIEKDKLIYGDVLFNTRNTPELVGKVAIWKNELPLAYFNSNLLRFNFNLEKSNPFFMNLIFNTEKTISEFKNIAKGTTSVAAIYPQDMLKVKIQIPPLCEQERIAEALSDVDSMISSLEKLIAKKKAVKQGAMQELLKGKKRLPGFTGNWESKCNLFSFDKGIQLNSSLLNEIDAYPVYNGGREPSGYTDKFNCKGTIIISEGGNSCGFVNRVKQNFWAGGHCYYIYESDLNFDFLYHLLKFYETNIMGLRVGSGLPNIQKDALSKMKFLYPLDYAEQTAIASVLSDMDNEIEALEKKLDKTRQIKQGMMQQLLTGKIRLV